MYLVTTATKKIHALNKRIKIVQGGTSAGKTIGIIQVLIDKAQRDKTPTLTSITSESYPHLKRGAMKDFLHIMETSGYYDVNQWNKSESTYTFAHNGSKIEFFSLDAPHKVRGPRRERLFMNEANAGDFETFEQLDVRTTESIWIDYNPTGEFWVHEHIASEKRIERDDAEFIILTYLDNEALDEGIVKAIERRKHRKDWWTVYGLGKIGQGLEGLIYRDWKIVDEVPHEARLERYGLDFGFYPDPCAIVAIYYYNGGYILDEVNYLLEQSNREIGNTLKNMPKALVVADSAEPKSISEIKMFGINIIGCKKGTDSVRNGVKTVQDLEISVTKRSTNLIKEYRNYLFQVNKEGIADMGKPEKGNDHLMDALRYGLTSMINVQRRREMALAMRVPQFITNRKRRNRAR